MPVLEYQFVQVAVALAACEDIYQILAYCTTLRLTRGHLVYASAGAKPVTYRLTGSGVQIVVHRVDLSTPLTELHEQIS